MKDRVALVVGAANDIGRAISIKLARDGAKTFLVDSDPLKLGEVAAHLNAAGLQAETTTLDLTDTDAVKAAVEAILRKHERIDVLVNNVDRKDGVAISDSTLERWRSSLDANVAPVVSFCLNVIPAMRKRKYGRIVSVGSLDYLGTANKANYSASKSAMFGVTRSLALELAKDCITVNQVITGDVKCADNPLSEEDEARLAAQAPVQRLGKPEDIAFAVAFFAAESSRYVTGQNLIVCGGKSIYSSMSA